MKFSWLSKRIHLTILHPLTGSSSEDAYLIPNLAYLWHSFFPPSFRILLPSIRKMSLVSDVTCFREKPHFLRFFFLPFSFHRLLKLLSCKFEWHSKASARYTLVSWPYSPQGLKQEGKEGMGWNIMSSGSLVMMEVDVPIQVSLIVSQIWKANLPLS